MISSILHEYAVEGCVRPLKRIYCKRARAACPRINNSMPIQIAYAHRFAKRWTSKLDTSSIRFRSTSQKKLWSCREFTWVATEVCVICVVIGGAVSGNYIQRSRKRTRIWIVRIVSSSSLQTQCSISPEYVTSIFVSPRAVYPPHHRIRTDGDRATRLLGNGCG